MRAAIVSEIGAAPRLGERDAPRPGAGQTLVRVSAAALNPVDLHIAGGHFFSGPPHVPFIPGREGVGEPAGDAGRRVRFECWNVGYGGDGSMAELALAADESMIELPPEVDDAVAAGLGTAGITAWMALERAGLEAGETVLVLGGTGALGKLAVQCAKILGAARVVAAGRNAEQLERVRELGGDAVVQLEDGMTRAAMTEAFKDATGGGPDVIVDPLFGDPAAAALEAGAPEARLVNVGRVAGGESLFTPATLRNKTAMGLSTHYTASDVKREVYLRLVDHVLAGRLTLDHDVLPLEDAPEGWRRQASSPGGKLIFEPSA